MNRFVNFRPSTRTYVVKAIKGFQVGIGAFTIFVYRAIFYIFPVLFLHILIYFRDLKV